MSSEDFKKLEQTEALLIELYNGYEFTNELSAGCIHDAIAAVQVEMVELGRRTQLDRLEEIAKKASKGE